MSGMRWSEEQLRAFEKGKRQARSGAKRANKFNAQRVGDADSKKEDRRLQDLRLLEKAGEIRELKHHVIYSLHVNGIHICDYEADFTYYAPDQPTKLTVEDAKGVRTPMYRLKQRLMRAIHGIEILET